MTKDQVKSTLALTLEDHQLSRSEREALRQVFEPLREAVGPQELHRLAFEVAREATTGCERRRRSRVARGAAQAARSIGAEGRSPGGGGLFQPPG